MRSNPALIRKILRHLYRRDYWGERHTSIENAIKGLPGHLIGDAKKAVDKLIKEQYLRPKPAHYGLQISLNREKKKEIEVIIHGE